MNSQNSILLVDPAFDPNTSSNRSLLIRLGIDSFSYAILDKEKNKISAVFDQQECDNVEETLTERLKNDVYLGLAFNDIKLAIHTGNNISVPNVLFDKDEVKLNAKFFNLPHAENIHTTFHANYDFTSIFSFSKTTDQIVSNSLSQSKKFPSNVALLKLAENKGNNALFLDFSAGAMYVLYLNEKKVVFQQTYELANTDEFNYYLLLVMKELAFEYKDLEVYLSGIIHENDEKHACLKDYFDNIQFLSFVDHNLDLEVLEDMPSHYYTTLLALDQCV